MSANRYAVQELLVATFAALTAQALGASIAASLLVAALVIAILGLLPKLS